LHSVLEAFCAGTAGDDEIARFFGRVRLSNGVFKTTQSHRLDDLNDGAGALLPRDRMLELMDVGVSSGTTTAQWSAQLAVPHRIVAGDVLLSAKWTHLRIANILHKDAIIYTDVLGKPIDVCAGRLRRSIAPLLLRVVRKLPARSILLIDPRVKASDTIEFVEDDIFTPRPEFSGRFDAVRAANILNRGYFSDDRIRVGIANLVDRLRPGGLLIVCRTLDDGTNNGGVYRVGSVAEEVARVGSGSEIHEFVVAKAAAA